MSKLRFSILESIQWSLQRVFSRFVGLLCECRWRWVKTILIRGFMRFYHIDLKDCVKTRIQDYESLNDFFTRPLRAEARPYEKNLGSVLSPVDGCISQMGIIQGETLLQAKGKTYTLYDLLAGDQATADLFKGGYFLTFYLAPSDYHRVHMPIAGAIAHTTYVPGFLFSVGLRNTRRVSQLFTRNERIISLFESEKGPFMMIQVGSCLVGHMGTVWEKTGKRLRRSQSIERTTYPNQEHHLKQVAEMGYFKLGSTVILLFGQGKIQWEENLYLGKQLRFGERIGEVAP
jgi:phosphatidylserine decarboxylase